MNIKIKASVTLRNGIETDWDTICITQHDIIDFEYENIKMYKLLKREIKGKERKE